MKKNNTNNKFNSKKDVIFFLTTLNCVLFLSIGCIVIHIAKACLGYF